MRKGWLMRFLVLMTLFLSILLTIVYFAIHTGHCDRLLRDPAVQTALRALPPGIQKLFLAGMPERQPVTSPAAGKAQTDAYLSIPQLKEKVDHLFGAQLRDYAALIETIKQKERDLSAQYYVFYHAQPMGFLLFYDLEFEIRTWLNKHPAIDFVGLRVPDASFNINEPMLNFIERKMQSFNYCYNFDTSPGMSDYLLATNVSLFGNTGWPSESTFYFFINNAYNAALLREELRPGREKLLPAKVLIKLMQGMGFTETATTKYLSRLKGVLSKLGACQPKTGLLLQIFVPRATIDNHAYLSAAFGMFPPLLEAPNTDPNYLGFYSTGEYLRDLTKVNATKKPVLLSLYLEQFRQDPASLGADKVNGLQARLVLNTGLLNPESGIKIFKYIVMDESCKQQYQNELAAVAKDMMYAWYKQTGVSSAKLDACFR